MPRLTECTQYLLPVKRPVNALAAPLSTTVAPLLRRLLLLLRDPVKWTYRED